MTAKAGSGHPGGSLSAADVVAALYFNVMDHRPADPAWPDRDRFVLSKGHAAPVLYAALAEAGYFPVQELATLRCYGSILQGHPDMCKTPGVEICSGSLGQGLAAACGMATAAKMDTASWRVYAMIGDGESQEGEIWESSMFAAHYGLDNLTCVLDYNRLQIDGRVEEVMSIDCPKEKWASFGWNVLEIDGHDFPQILAAFDEARGVAGKPTMIVANTVKGKGVSFMENQVDFHGKAPTEEQRRAALEELAEEPVQETAEVGDWSVP
ncbi:MAG: transketolase [Actinobacteria bacterium]|nr:MAG: transketolase [Actinomycetota bacterium]